MRFVARNLRVRYPVQERWAVDGIDLEIAPGHVTWLTGALGSGTSTLLLALAGLAPRLTGGERSGTVLADNVDVAAISRASRISARRPRSRSAALRRPCTTKSRWDR